MYFIYHRRLPTVDVTCNIRNMMMIMVRSWVSDDVYFYDGTNLIKVLLNQRSLSYFDREPLLHYIYNRKNEDFLIIIK